MIGRARAVFDPPAAAASDIRCDSCHATGPIVQPAVVYGIAVNMCTEPLTCRLRAQNAGMWCTYEPMLRP